MSRYNNSPVDPLKIQLVHDMLSSPLVNALWLEFVHLGTVPNVNYKLRDKAFNNYATARDAFLGLKPLVITPIQGSHKRNMV